MTWTVDTIEYLRKNYRVISASRIAAQLGTTRSAIIGKARRLGLGVPMGDRERIKKEKKKSAPTYRLHRIDGKFKFRRIEDRPPPYLTALDRPLGEPKPKNLSVLKIENEQCRFIPGDDLLFCGHETQEGSSYCPYHHALCWVRPADRKRVA